MSSDGVRRGGRRRGAVSAASSRLMRNKDVLAGLLFVSFGAAFAVASAGFRVGEAARMGPGYFPLILASLLILLGAATALNALRRDRAQGDAATIAVPWAPLLLVLAALGLFAATLPVLGLPIAIFVLVVVASAAGRDFGWRRVLLLAAGLIGFTYLAFVRGLGLPLPILPVLG